MIHHSIIPIRLVTNTTQHKNIYSSILYKLIHTQQKCNLHTTRTSTASIRDPYTVLGVSKSATKDEIKKSYFKLAKQYHPDLRPGDKSAADKFAELGNAYDVLSDDDKRRAYDTYGTADPQEQAAYQAQQQYGGFNTQGNPFGGFGTGGTNTGTRGFEDIFGNMFRQQTNMRSPTRGSDLTTTATISFNEAVTGTTREIRLTRNTVCNSCSGSGHKTSTSTSTQQCTQCGGTGQTISNRGIFQMQQTCTVCNGTGRSAPQCTTCAGTGLVRETKTITVNIPAGVNDDTTLRIPNQGDAGELGGPRGHLYVKLNIQQDNRFRRDGSDIYVDVNIPVTTAMLGGYVNVPTLTGEARVKVDSGIQHGDKRRLRGKGMNVLNSNKKGDQYVVFNIKIPNNLNTIQRNTVEQLHHQLGIRELHTDIHTNITTNTNDNNNDPNNLASKPTTSNTSSTTDTTTSNNDNGLFSRWFGNTNKDNK